MAIYRVWVRSKPGMYSQYDGFVEVYGESHEEAEDNAYRKLRRGSFPDRNRSMWKTEKIEVVG